MKWVSFAWRNVLRNKRRTAIAAGTIAMGTIALLAAAGYVNATFFGLREATIKGGVGHFQIGLPGQFGGFEETPLEFALPRRDAKVVSETLKRNPAVEFAMQRIHFEGLVFNGERTVIFIGQGVEPKKEIRLSRNFAPIVSGRGLPKITMDNEQKLYQAILAKDLAKNLGAKPGDNITLLSTTVHGALNAVDLTVSGIFTTGIPERDERYLMVPLPIAQKLLSTDKVSRVIGVLENTENVEPVVEMLRTAFPKLETRDWLSLAPFYQKVVVLYRSIFSVMGAIVVLVVLLSSTNTLLMSIMERSREIGTIRTFGISRVRLKVNFLIEGGLIGMIGAVAGGVAAFGLAELINSAHIMLPPPPGMNISVPLHFLIEGPHFVAVALLLIAVGSVSAWYPSRHAVRKKIVDALGHV